MLRIGVLSVSLIAFVFLASFNFVEPDSSGSAALPADGVQYFIMVDAGSTGSRVHVHQYTLSNEGLPNIFPSTNKKLKPGLSSYAKNPKDAAKSMADLIEYAKKLVPMSMWHVTPVHVQATAGLRSIPENEAEEVLEQVRNYLDKTGFKFRRKWAKIITGAEEGINGWMAANYLLEVFSSKPGDATPISTGVVEMGGTSLQLTYVPENPQAADRMLLTEVTVAGHKYFLYTHSYLHYGLQAAEKMFQRVNMDAIEESGNPCYARGFRHSSTGTFASCLALVAKMMDKTSSCPASSCSFNGIYQPPLVGENGPFIAIENFYYTLQFFKAHDMTVPAKEKNRVVAALKIKGGEFCGSDWNTLKTTYSTLPENELATYCFAAAYEASMLEHGLGFTKDSDVKAVREITGKAIDWALGAVLGEILKQETDGDEGKPRVVFDPKDPKSAKAAGEGDLRDPSVRDQYAVDPSTKLGWYAGAFILISGVGVFVYRRYLQRPARASSRYANAFSRV